MIYSYTDLTTYHRCKFLYQQTRINDWHQDPSSPQILGDIVHAGMAAYARRLNTVQAMAHRWQELQVVRFEGDSGEPKETLLNAYRIVLGAVRFLGNNWETVDLDGQPLVESDLRINFPFKDIKGEEYEGFHGIVDWVARDKETGWVWLFDYKVRASIDAEINEDFNLQMAIYQYLLAQKGIKTAGSICFQMRSAPLQLPVMTIKGTMSRADIVCDWDSYRNELVSNGLDPDDYKDMQVKLSNKRFYTLSRSYRSPELLTRIWKDVVMNTIDEIRDFRNNIYWDALGRYVAPRNMSGMCKICGIRDACQNHLRGVTPDFNVVLED